MRNLGGSCEPTARSVASDASCAPSALRASSANAVIDTPISKTAEIRKLLMMRINASVLEFRARHAAHEVLDPGQHRGELIVHPRRSFNEHELRGNVMAT